jgi:hypothetical protein
VGEADRAGAIAVGPLLPSVRAAVVDGREWAALSDVVLASAPAAAALAEQALAVESIPRRLASAARQLALRAPEARTTGAADQADAANRNGAAASRDRRRWSHRRN